MNKSRVEDRDRGWGAMLKGVAQLARGADVKVGILSDDERGGLHIPGARLTVAEIAVVQEYGTVDGRIPARSFVRATFDRMRDELANDGAKLLVKILLDRVQTVEGALNLLGLKLATGIRNYVTEGAGVPPPNAPTTVAAKVPKSYTGKRRERAIMGNRPLVDTGRMINAISWAVRMGETEQPHQFVEKRKVVVAEEE